MNGLINIIGNIIRGTIEGSGGGSISDWILATGSWRDVGYWRDTEVWID